ncbi:MAG: LON peptidase substrate-binding domain-containing protein, partial [Treponema sp.]|nr:LON peptidase substrate-binding domain-containing protein [Treponema sp.]
MKDNFDVDINLDDLPDSADVEKAESQENPVEKTEKSETETAAETALPAEEGEPAKKKGKRAKKVSVKDLGEDAQILPIEDFLPPKLNIIPMAGHPMFPGIFTPIMINSGDDTKTIENAYEGDGFIGLVMLKDDDPKDGDKAPTIKDLYTVGTVARIVRKINLPDGGLNIFISSIKRFKIRKTLNAQGPIVAAVEYLEDEEFDTFEVKALTRALISEMKEISENNPLFSEEMRLNMVNIDNPGKIADFVASVLNVDKEEQQKVLEETNVRARMEQVLVYIKKDQDLLRIQKKIQNELNENFEKNQREYFLREEMKMIQDELGVGEDGSDYQKFKARIADFEFEGEILETVENELEKFKL